MLNFNGKFFLNYFLLIFWMGVIFYFSSQPELKSGFENRIDFILRKLAHMTEYAVLTFLAWRAISDMRVKNDLKCLFLAIIFSVLYAISDEYHQTFVAGRVGSYKDVLIDGIGIVIMAFLIKIKLASRN